jgi:hypothetical protein
MEIMHRIGSLNCIHISLQFVLASGIRLKYLEESRRPKFIPDLVFPYLFLSDYQRNRRRYTEDTPI